MDDRKRTNESHARRTRAVATSLEFPDVLQGDEKAVIRERLADFMHAHPPKAGQKGRKKKL